MHLMPGATNHLNGWQAAEQNRAEVNHYVITILILGVIMCPDCRHVPYCRDEFCNPIIPV